MNPVNKMSSRRLWITAFAAAVMLTGSAAYARTYGSKLGDCEKAGYARGVLVTISPADRIGQYLCVAKSSTAQRPLDLKMRELVINKKAPKGIIYVEEVEPKSREAQTTTQQPTPQK